MNPRLLQTYGGAVIAAWDLQCPPEVLDRSARLWPEVRLALELWSSLGSNPNTPTEHLVRLANELIERPMHGFWQWMILQKLVRNPNVPPQICAKLLRMLIPDSP